MYLRNNASPMRRREAQVYVKWQLLWRLYCLVIIEWRGGFWRGLRLLLLRQVPLPLVIAATFLSGTS
jgi:hypothetical protein